MWSPDYKEYTGWSEHKKRNCHTNNTASVMAHSAPVGPATNASHVNVKQGHDHNCNKTKDMHGICHVKARAMSRENMNTERYSKWGVKFSVQNLVLPSSAAQHDCLDAVQDTRSDSRRFTYRFAATDLLPVLP